MKQFVAWLETMEETLRAESVKLAADDRRDEGALAKIRANVYGICKSVFQVLDAEKADAKLNELYTAWGSARSTAQQHEDTEKAAVEEIKMEVLEDVRKKRNHLIGVDAV